MKSIEVQIRETLREHAPEVKGFMWDKVFTGQVIVYMRKDKGPKGYDVIEKKFKDPQELLDYYASRQSKKSVKESVKGTRTIVKKHSRTVESTLAKPKSKKRNSR